MMTTEPQNESVKIMTVMGPIDADETIFGPAMMYEKIIANPSGQSIASSTSQASSPQLAFIMENLSAIRANPFENVENMLLNSENEACREIRHLSDCVAKDDSNKDKKLFIMDMTTANEGRDYKACQRISQQLEIHVLIGTTCPESAGNELSSNDMDDLQKNMEHMERELKYGIGTKSEDDYKNLTSSDSKIVRCSFCGPVHISQEFSQLEQNQLKAYAAVHGSTKAPLVIVAPSLSTVSSLLDFVIKSGGIAAKTIVAHADLLVHRHAKQNDMAAALQLLQENALDRGAILCFDSYSISGCACFDFDQEFPTLGFVVGMIDQLLQTNPAYAEQVVLSSGITMKLQLQKYGGAGYSMAIKELVPRLLKQKDITAEHIDLMLHKTPRRLLHWWVPPPTPEVPKYYLTCSICKKKFEPILGEYFSKYTFVYCDTKCLRKHRKLGFEPLEETS